MTPFNNELHVGQQAMIINVELAHNISNIGNVVTVLDLMSLEESREYFMISERHKDFRVDHPYAVIDDGTSEGYDGNISIRQDYLMPLPPLGDMYDQEMMDEMENYKVGA